VVAVKAPLFAAKSGVQAVEGSGLHSARRRELRREEDVWLKLWRRPRSALRVGWQPAAVIGSGRRRSFAANEDSLFCLHREPARVGPRSLRQSAGATSEPENGEPPGVDTMRN
jgi:hypothetical protein